MLVRVTMSTPLTVAESMKREIERPPPHVRSRTPFRAKYQMSLYPRTRSPPGKSSARPETAAAFLATPADFRATETVLSRVCGCKAAESQRLFRPRQETAFARDCVVGLVGLKLTTTRL